VYRAYSKHRRQQAVGKRIGRDPLRAADEQERRNGQTLQFIMCSDLYRVLKAHHINKETCGIHERGKKWLHTFHWKGSCSGPIWKPRGNLQIRLLLKLIPKILTMD
jgi:hypothetical protein